MNERDIGEMKIDFDSNDEFWIEIDRIAKLAGWSLGFTLLNLARHALGIYPGLFMNHEYMDRLIHPAVAEPEEQSGKQCPNCKRYTLYDSGNEEDEDWHCTSCGYDPRYHQP